MDQLSAHLDRGWDLVGKGDLKSARISAQRALQSEPKSPEAHNLLGFVAAQDGDSDEALDHYRQAMSLDDGYIDPFLNAAEVLIHPLQEFDEAIHLCDEVLEFADGDDERADALLLKVDALLGKGETATAREVIASVPEASLATPHYAFLVGRALVDVGEFERALPHLRLAVEKDPTNPDAQHALGVAYVSREQIAAAAPHLLSAREIDLTTPSQSWAPSKELFQRAVEKAIGAIDAALVTSLKGAAVFVSDVPGVEVVAEGADPRAPLLFDAIDAVDESGTPCARRVFVYKRNIERLCGGIEQIEDEIKLQFEEEIRHVRAHPEEWLPAPEGDAPTRELSREGESR